MISLSNRTSMALFSDPMDHYSHRVRIVLAATAEPEILAAKSKLLISTDTSIVDVHFLKSMPSDAIAYRSVAVALSDIAAMGGQPIAFNLSLVMPNLNLDWMKGFRKGLQKISREYKFPLIGGDLVKGPLQISVTVIGKPQKNTLLRSSAKAGDILCLSDKLGSGYIAFREFKKLKIYNMHHLEPIMLII